MPVYHLISGCPRNLRKCWSGIGTAAIADNEVVSDARSTGGLLCSAHAPSVAGYSPRSKGPSKSNESIAKEAERCPGKGQGGCGAWRQLQQLDSCHPGLGVVCSKEITATCRASYGSIQACIDVTHGRDLRTKWSGKL